jgi:chromate transporter
LYYVVAALAFLAIFWGNVPFPVIILGALLIGAVAHYTQKHQPNAAKKQTQDEAETNYLIHSNTVVPDSGWSTRRLVGQLAVAGVLWSAPLALLAAVAPNFPFWKTLVLFFTKAALVTFGGAYAVLPYVAQVSVEQFGWLSGPEMLDGLALGETTPGPLIIVLAFVGFMAGHHTFGGSLGAATLGLGLTVWYTFLPSFVFILVGAPLVERTQANPAVKAILQYATAAVAGVILNLCLYLGQSVLAPQFPDIQWIALAWTAVSLLALQYFKVNLLAWIGVSVAAGLTVYFLGFS